MHVRHGWVGLAITLAACVTTEERQGAGEGGADASYGHWADAAGAGDATVRSDGAGAPGGTDGGGWVDASASGDAGGRVDASMGGDAGRWDLDAGPGSDAATGAADGGDSGSAPCTPSSAGTNDATFVAHTLPAAVVCGQTVEATVTVRNTGTTTWSGALGYKLGAQDDEDPLYPWGTRVTLPEGACIPPGGEHTFTIPLQGPATAGAVLTDWRMVLEEVEWFGGVVAQGVDVSCAAPGEDAFDLSAAIIVKGAPGVATWPMTATLDEVTIASEELCTYHSKAGQWPTVPFFDDPENPIEGNQWYFANIGGTWYGGAGEWLRPGQQCKIVNTDALGPDEFYGGEEPLYSWIPEPGELIGVMVSTPARAWPAMATLDERSNVVLVPWPQL